MKIDPSELLESDRYLTACHEAGHVVVAFINGLACRAWLSVNDKINSMDESTVVGTAQHFQEISFDKNAGGVVYGPIGDSRVRSQIAIAGIVAEGIAEGLAENEIIDLIFLEELVPSPADLEALPENISSWPVEQAFSILRENSEFHAAIVARLVENGSISDGQVKGLANSLSIQRQIAPPTH